MFQPVSVSLSGSAFSFLLYETSKDIVRQNGFLLGEVVHKEITSITDNDQKQVEVSKIIKINSVIPFPSNNYFSRGRVEKEKLRKYLGSNFSKVVAWYKYEHSSPTRLTLKERALHKQFRELFNVPQDLFTVCFLSSDSTDNFASYNYQQNFMRYYSGSYDKLVLYIPNLSDSNNTYKNSEPASEVFNKILASIKMDIDNTKGVVAVTEIENAVQNYINQTVVELATAEKELFDLEEEVTILREKIFMDGTIQEANQLETDLISFEESVQPQCREDLPEIEKRVHRTRSKANSNIPERNIDSNRKGSITPSEIQGSPEVVKKSPSPKAKGRGCGRKKM